VIAQANMTRKTFLQDYLGLGSLALLHLLKSDASAATPAAESAPNPLTPRPQAKAKHCIFLFMEGGVSQVDTFDYKPVLAKYGGKTMSAPADITGSIASNLQSQHQVIPSPFRFAQHGQSGRWMCELFPHLAQCVDDMAFFYGVKLENSNHPPGVFPVMTGNMFPGSPSMGAWINYGLVTENQDLPGYVVLADGAPAVGGAAVWGSGYLPAAYQGTLFRTGSRPIINLSPQSGVTEQSQRQELDLLPWFNERHAGLRQNPGELAARIQSYEVAFRMQSEAPKLIDLCGETDTTRELYGLNNPTTEKFAHQCLLARRMVERGVRFVMALHSKTEPWDDHSDIKNKLPLHCVEVDKPVSGPLKDLKSRGLLEETLVVWATEMGRLPYDSDLVITTPGRNHNNLAMAMWMAGGDVKGGAAIGQTDEFGLHGIGDVVQMRDVHATLLRLLGLDQNRLTVLHGGRFKKRTDIGGRVLSQVIA
jgi:hypothetical protein